MNALWLPYETPDPVAAAFFYTDHFGLSTVDSWEGGIVLRVLDDVYLELAAPGEGAPAPVAFELDSRSSVDAAHFAGAGPTRVFPRGHYGFDAAAPGVGRVMVWST